MANHKPPTKANHKPAKPAQEKPPAVPVEVTVVPPPPVIAAQPEIVPEPRPPEPVPAAEPVKGLTPEEEIEVVRKRIAADTARLWELEHPIIEFPKMVRGRTFNTRAEQDAAGPDYADAKKDG